MKLILAVIIIFFGVSLIDIADTSLSGNLLAAVGGGIIGFGIYAARKV